MKYTPSPLPRTSRAEWMALRWLVTQRPGFGPDVLVGYYVEREGEDGKVPGRRGSARRTFWHLFRAGYVDGFQGRPGRYKVTAEGRAVASVEEASSRVAGSATRTA